MIRKKPKLVVHIQESTWVRRRTPPLSGCAHLPRILYRSVIYGYFIIIGHPSRWSPPLVSTLTLQTWMRWRKKRTIFVRREQAGTTAEERYHWILNPISSFVDITLGCYQALIWHAWMINFLTKQVNSSRGYDTQPSTVNDVGRHNNSPQSNSRKIFLTWTW